MKVKIGDFNWSRIRSEQDKICYAFYQKLKTKLYVLEGKEEKIHTTSTSLENKSATTKASPSEAKNLEDDTQPEKGPGTRSKATTDDDTPEQSFSKEVTRAITRSKDCKHLANTAAKKGTHPPSAVAVRQKAIQKNADKLRLPLNKDGEQLPLKRAPKRKVPTSIKSEEYYNKIIENLFNDHSKKLKLKKF